MLTIFRGTPIRKGPVRSDIGNGQYHDLFRGLWPSHELPRTRRLWDIRLLRLGSRLRSLRLAASKYCWMPHLRGYFFVRLFRLTKYQLPLVLVLTDVPRAFFLLRLDTFGSEMPVLAVAPLRRPASVKIAT